MSMSRTVLILHPGGLGDLLLAVPAIRSLRQRFPSHQFLLCAQAQAAEFLHECGVVDRWISAQTTASMALFGGMAPDDPLLVDWLGRCDLAVAWTHDESGTLTAALKESGAVSAIVQSPFATTLSSVHQSERFIEIVDARTCQVPMTPLSVPKILRTAAKTHLDGHGLPARRSLALVHPGSGSRHKCVNPALLLSVIERLESEGLEPLVLEGPADRETVERLLSLMSRRPIVLRGLSIGLLAGVLSQVDLFLGHDSGVTHLAALLGTPTVALFGPTDALRWAPRGPAVTVVKDKPCVCASWDAVKSCTQKPCLALSPQTILASCRTTRLVTVNPRIC